MRHRHHRALVALAAFIAAVLLASCAVGAGADDADRASADPTSETSSVASKPAAAKVCFNPHGGACLGSLEPGDYRTKVFKPALRYSVPGGWVNGEDLPGNFLLYREDDPHEGFTAGSYVGIFTGVRIPDGCEEAWDEGVGDDPQEMLQWYVDHPGLEVGNQRRVSVGGLDGVAIDLRLANGYRKTCPWSEGDPVVPLIIGNGVSSLHHVILEELTIRLVLLEWKRSNVTIEITSQRDQHTFGQYRQLTRPVIDSLRFAGR